MAQEDLRLRLRELRQQGRLVQARELLARQLHQRADDGLAFLAWQHEDFWWQPIAGPRVRLRRRGPQDAAFVRRCWNDSSFMQRFNRMAAPLPPHDGELQALLAREHWALPQESLGLHWTIDSGGVAQGFASVVQLSFQHRRAEFLIGVLPGAGNWAAAEAAHLVFDFLMSRARIERLSAHFYPENPQALNLALRLGFESEGVLRSYLRAADGSRSDLIVSSLLLDQTFLSRTARMRRRLLGV